MFKMFVPDVPPTGWRWYANFVSTTALCLIFGAAFGYGGWEMASEDGAYPDAVMAAAFVLFYAVIPFAALYAKKRTEEMKCPQHVTLHGRPALLFPGDRRGMRVSAVLYLVLAILNVSAFLPDSFHETPLPVLLILWSPAALFLSYTLFAIAGRFVEDGTFLTEQGVTIRARGLRAELPWNSIAGSTTYRRSPFPYERIAIHLHPGSPREVSTTVPWWVGSPRPRGDTVFLTKVQVPGFYLHDCATNPGDWIAVFAQNPPSAEYLASLTDPVVFSEAHQRLLLA